MDRFDFIVIGTGAAGESAANAALERGKTVAVVERELVGGSCSFWACIPTKALLHAATEHRRGGYSWERASARRDYMINRERRDWPDDTGHVKALETAGARIYMGEGRIAGPGLVEVGPGPASPRATARRIEAGTIILATGSQPKVPEIDGLAEAEPWTNREATSTRKLPRSVVILGGGPMGVELGEFFALFGVATTVVHSHDRLIDKDHRRVSEAAARIMRDDGVDLRLGVRTLRVRAGAGERGAHVVELSDGKSVEAERLVLALGRTFGLENLGLDRIGLHPGKLKPDGRLRIADGVYLIGDPAGPEMFTHVSYYQGIVAVRMALGEDVAPDYRAIPRAVFVEPELASVGLSLEAAHEAGIDAFEKVADFAKSTRGYELEAEFGHLAIVVDRRTETLIGGSVVAPDASAAIHETVLAIQERIPVPQLASIMHGFPTTSRAFNGLYAEALKDLRAPVPA
jgi:dihydrolipoamide dehydrogenase